MAEACTVYSSCNTDCIAKKPGKWKFFFREPSLYNTAVFLLRRTASTRSCRHALLQLQQDKKKAVYILAFFLGLILCPGTFQPGHGNIYPDNTNANRLFLKGKWKDMQDNSNGVHVELAYLLLMQLFFF